MTGEVDGRGRAEDANAVGPPVARRVWRSDWTMWLQTRMTPGW